MELAFSREQGAMFVGDRGGEVYIRIVAIPRLEHGGHVATQNQQAILVGFDDPRGVNQRFIEQEGGASRGFDLMDHGRIFHRRRDDILLRDIRGHLVRTGDHRRAPVLGAQIRQIRERFDKREVVKAVFLVIIGRIDATMESQATVLLRYGATNMGVGLLESHRPAGDLLRHTDDTRVCDVVEERRSQMGQIVDAEELLCGACVEAVRARHLPCCPESILDLVQRVCNGRDLSVRQQILEDDIPVDLDMEPLGRRQGWKGDLSHSVTHGKEVLRKRVGESGCYTTEGFAIDQRSCLPSAIDLLLQFVSTQHVSISVRLRRPFLKLIDVRRIWDSSPHSAFTDLVHFDGAWTCTFREALDHRSNGGQLRVIRSEDGINWQTAEVMVWDEGDLRDPKLSVTGNGRLMLNAVVRYHEPVNGHAYQSLTWLTENGLDWDGPHACPSGRDTWRWSATWHDGVGYSFGYHGKDERGTLYQTHDGVTWETVQEEVFPGVDSFGNESSLLFLDDGTAYCLLRRDAEGEDGALLGTAQPPYTQWQWSDLGVRMGGPKIIRLLDGRFVAAVRSYGDERRTTVYWIDPAQSTATPCLKLPSAGDTSYTGIVEQDGILWMSYYSSHEEKTAIYLAKVGLE